MRNTPSLFDLNVDNCYRTFALFIPIIALNCIQMPMAAATGGNQIALYVFIAQAAIVQVMNA
jgi:Na+-translocating ferredoxin:NAD+ oxidoreductase RnfE subunit